MDELVKNTKIIDAELVRAVGSLFPGESIEYVLDKVRYIIQKRAINKCKSKQFLTVIHLVEHLKTAGLTPSDVKKVIEELANDQEVHDHLKKDIVNMLNSGMFESVFKFVCEIEPIIEETNPRLNCFCLGSRRG